MNSKLRLTIGLPVYNGEKFLVEALDSILAQTFSNFELIISDNASTDSTEQICHEYAARDARIRYYRNETNLGAAANYNRVYKLTNTELFKWVAHDDMYEPTFIERCVEALDADSGLVLAYTRAMEIDENGREIDSKANRFFDLHEDAPDPTERFRHFALMDHTCFSIFGVIRRHYLEDTPLIAPYVGSDEVLLIMLVLRGRFIELPERLFLRREHPYTSTKGTPIPQERAAWFDPDKAKHRIYPNWRKLYEYYRVLRRSNLSWREKQKCYVTLLRWVSWFRSRLWADLRYHLRFLFRRPGSR